MKEHSLIHHNIQPPPPKKKNIYTYFFGIFYLGSFMKGHWALWVIISEGLVFRVLDLKAAGSIRASHTKRCSTRLRYVIYSIAFEHYGML